MACQRLQRCLLLLAITVLSPALADAASVSRRPAAAKAGDIFRDCSYCPEMVAIPPGSFIMGSPTADPARSENEGPAHAVKIARPIAVGRTAVTQVQWVALMGGNPSYFANCGADCPVEWVSWNDAREYISRLNAKTGKDYRLPSEAEWEYACRAGGTQAYCGSDDPESVAWYGTNSANTTHPVAGKKANAWGLHDMSGNVFEWVEDCWNRNYERAPTDASAWTSGQCSMRVLRGGAWWSGPEALRSAKRLRLATDDRNGISGFRVVRTLP